MFQGVINARSVDNEFVRRFLLGNPGTGYESGTLRDESGPLTRSANLVTQVKFLASDQNDMSRVDAF